MVKRRIKDGSGFSLAETLLAVLILLLVSLIVANGVPAVTRAYENVVIGANAKTLLSTAISALRDELATAKDVTVGSDGTTITYYSADIGATSKIYLERANEVEEGAGDGAGKEETASVIPMVMIDEYVDVNPSSFAANADSMQSVDARPLVSGIGTSSNGLYVTYDSAVLVGSESIRISGLCVKQGNSEALASADLTVRLLIPAPASA